MKEPQRKTILIVDDDHSVTDSFSLILTDAGFRVFTAQNFAESVRVLRNSSVDLVITDLSLPDGTGIDVITHVKTETPNVEVILMTAHGSPDVTIEAIKRGACDYFEKPCTLDRLHTLVNRALEFATLKRENETLKRTLSVIEHAVLFCSANQLLPECLPEEFEGACLRNSSFVIPPLVPMEEIEREAILQTLERTSGNVSRSAQILRFPRPTFYRKLKKLGIKVERPAGKLATSL